MKNKIRLIIFLMVPLLITACDPQQDVVTWVNDFINSYLADLVCWLYQIFVSLLQLVIDGLCAIVLPLVMLLPEYTINLPSLSSYEFMQIASYFVPITEAATMIKYLIEFYITFWFGRIILRWLKIIK